MGNLDMWLTYPAENKPLAHMPSVLFLPEGEDKIHHVPMGRAQATDIPCEMHRVGMFGDRGSGGKVVTSVRVDMPGSRSLGFQVENDGILDHEEERVQELGNLSGLSGSEEQDLGRVPHDLDWAFHLFGGVPCVLVIPLVLVEEAEAEAAGWRIGWYYRFLYWRVVRYC